MRKLFEGEFLRDFIFGVEDGLVSALGVVAGISGAALSVNIIFLAVFVEMFAGGISMSAGTYLSVKSQEEYLHSELKEKKIKIHKRELAPIERELKNPVKAAIIMFLSFIIGSLTPIVPFLLQTANTLLASIVFSAIGLFIFGATKTIFTKRNWIRSGLEMLILGMFAAVVGYYIGTLFKVEV